MTSWVNTPPCEQEVVVGLERLERLVERARHLRHLRQLLGREVVEVPVDRVGRLDLVLDAVEPGHEHRREREVRVAGRVGAAELDPLRLRALRVERDAHRRRAVALRVHEVHRRLVARHESLVRVRRRVRERDDRPARASADRRCTSAPCRRGRRSPSRRRTAARRPSTATGARACPSRCPGRSASA